MKIIFLSLLTLVSVIAFTQPTIKVNERRIEERIFELAKFGKDSIGRNYRVAFTKGDQEGRAWFTNLMKKVGLQVSIDYAGISLG